MPEFSATDFITRLGRSLIKEFEEARQATTSPLIGVAIETPVRRRLEQVLPRGIAVGSGCVIDSYGNCSRQQDVVLYERDICPVFSINDTPESTYYPCEGVMAVIEVKSSIASSELKDSFEKIASVKRLRRYDAYSPPPGEQYLEHRRYEGTQMANMVKFSDSKEDGAARPQPSIWSRSNREAQDESQHLPYQIRRTGRFIWGRVLSELGRNSRRRDIDTVHRGRRRTTGRILSQDGHPLPILGIRPDAEPHPLALSHPQARCYQPDCSFRSVYRRDWG